MSRLPLCVLAGLLVSAPLHAFQGPPTPKPATVTTEPPRQGQPSPSVPVAQGTPAAPQSKIDGRPTPSQNVRVEVTITDTFGTAPVKKTISMLIADTRSGRIRSTLNVAVPEKGDNLAYRQIGINVDAVPEVRPDGRVFLNLTVQYTPDGPFVALGSSERKPADINESFSVVLPDGKPTVLSQSADPQSDRRVTLEVTATVLK